MIPDVSDLRGRIYSSFAFSTHIDGEESMLQYVRQVNEVNDVAG